MDPDPAIFIIDLQDANTKLLKKSFSASYFLKVDFTSFFKDKKYERSHKTLDLRLLLLFLLADRIRIRIHTSD
jgi:hypothetical protein